MNTVLPVMLVLVWLELAHFSATGPLLFTPLIWDSMSFLLTVCAFLFFPVYVVMLLVASQYHGWVFLLQTCNRNSVHRSVDTLTSTHCRDLMKSVGKVVMDKLLSYMLLLMFPEQVTDCHFCSYCSFLLFLHYSLPLLCCSFFLVLKILILNSFFDLKEIF